ncbi:glycosyltransferase family 4 protein [Pseudolysinimonas sp.]|jgi:glycosyltransferase involved in cell wall biosynthesis|uniref:glycosyltransferase family 4 protein n=1 Tax=Pseudolysinimonas sp. TaxID=2680009 RepID=UPI0037846D6D
MPDDRTAPGLVLLAPYPERAAVALAGSPRRPALEVFGTAQVANTVRGAREVSRMRAGARARRFAENVVPHRWSLLPMHLGKLAFARGAVRHVASAHGVFGFPGASLEPFARSRGLRVMHAVDAHPRAHNEHLVNAFGRRAAAEVYPEWLVRRIERELELAHLVLVPSLLVATQMREHGVDPSRILVRPYGTDFGVFAPRAADGGAARLGRRPRVLFVGQLSLRKGIPFLLRASDGLDIELRLVGNVFDRELLARLPENVEVVPPTAHGRLRDEYAQADAFVLPTIEDACALVTMEAAAAGLPVVTTAMNGAIETFGAYPVNRVPVGDHVALAEALSAVEPLAADQRAANAARARSVIPDWAEYADGTWSAVRGDDD